jgi:hypothetical protein
MGLFGDGRPEMSQAHHGPNQGRHGRIGTLQDVHKSGNDANALGLNLVQRANAIVSRRRTKSRHQLKQTLAWIQHVARPTYRR